MEENLKRIEDKVDGLAQSMHELTAAVAQGFANIEERMATKEELALVEEKLVSKIDGLGRRMDAEVDNHTQIETRIHKLEEAVFPVQI